MRIHRIWIRNFKSLHNVSLDLNRLNIVVGPNGSGKTNLVDAFEFFKNILAGEKTLAPWLRWWNYKNIVWMQDDTLPITFGFEIIIGKYRVIYEKIISVTGGSIQNLREIIDIKGWSKIILEGELIRVYYEEEVKDIIKDAVPRTEHLLLRINDKLFTELEEGLPLRRPGNLIEILRKTPVRSDIYKDSIKISLLYLPSVFFKNIKYIRKYPFLPLIFPVSDRESVAKQLLSFPQKITIVRQLDFEKLKSPIEPRREEELRSDCSNLYNVLYNLFLKENKIPDVILENTRIAFPEYNINFGVIVSTVKFCSSVIS